METILERVTPTIGEGPHWDDASQSLIFVDIDDGIIFRWDQKTKNLEKHKFGMCLHCFISTLSKNSSRQFEIYFILFYLFIYFYFFFQKISNINSEIR